MDDSTLVEVLIRNRDGMAGAAVASLLFSVTYVIAKGWDLRMAAKSILSGVIFATVGWLFLCEWLKLSVIYIVPVGLVSAYGAVPIAKAWARRDDRLADKALDIAQRRINPDGE